MATVVVSVRHRLPVPVVRRRISAWLAGGGPGAVVPCVDRTWQGNCLHFEATVHGRAIAAEIVVTEAQVTAVAALPWQFLPFAASIREQVASGLRGLLDG